MTKTMVHKYRVAAAVGVERFRGTNLSLERVVNSYKCIKRAKSFIKVFYPFFYIHTLICLPDSCPAACVDKLHPVLVKLQLNCSSSCCLRPPPGGRQRGGRRFATEANEIIRSSIPANKHCNSAARCCGCRGSTKDSLSIVAAAHFLGICIFAPW